MIEGFDKEIDALLRQTAQGEIAPENSKFRIENPKSLHLDADEISLFAENALPKKIHENAVAHFADCDRCRKILSNLIAENSENEVVSIEQNKVFAPTIPWYRKLFAFPNLAYTLGALVLVFSGIIAFTVLQSVDKSENAEVSQVSERPIGGKGMSSEGETVTVEKQNTDAATSSSMSNASSMSNSAATSSSNALTSNVSKSSVARNPNLNSASSTSSAANKPSVPANESPKNEAQSEGEIAQQQITSLPLNGRSIQNFKELKREQDKKEDKNEAATTDMVRVAPMPKPEQPSMSDDEVTSSDASKAKSKKLSRLQSVETTSVGGKTFQRQHNVWIDSAYKNQATTNITRGTNDYKKLDSGLRMIAENLGGTLIVVWKDKAYRIQ